MNKRLACLLLTLSLLLSGCIYGAGRDAGRYATVYIINPHAAGGEAFLARQELKLRSGEDELDRILTELNYSSSVLAQEAELPYGVRISDCTVDAGVAQVEVTEEYTELEPLERLLADSAITLSLMTLDPVCSVDIYCGKLCLAEGLSIEYIAEADGLFRSYERTLKLYLPDGEGGLQPVSRSVRSEGGTPREELILRELLSELRGDARPVEILALSVEDGICTVDLSAEFYGIEPADSASGKLLLQAIVNSLCRLPGIDSVSIMVAGRAAESFGGFRPLWPMSPDESLVSYR